MILPRFYHSLELNHVLEIVIDTLYVYIMWNITTPDLHITAGIITAEFVRTGSDIPSLSVMSLKIKKK